MLFQVLGGLRVSDGDRPIDLGGPRQRLLLAVLLTRPNEPVTIDLLVDALWDGEEAPSRPSRPVQTYVSRLRRALGAGRIETVPSGYRLLVEDGQLDATRFRAHVERGRRQAAAGEAAAGLDELRTADALWVGRPWGELADRWWALPTVRQLEELRLAAVQLSAELLLDVGDPARSLEMVVPQLADHPLHDGLRRIQLLALHRSGRSVEASRQYRLHRDRVVAETGLEPSADLVELEAGIVRGDAELQPATLHGFELLRRLGEGPNAVVWHASQHRLGREVALKVLRPERADDPEVIRAFESRVRRLVALAHPHLIPILDAWRDHRGAYVVMPLLDGPGTERGGAGDVLRVLDAASTALEALHGLGIVHGPIEPQDLLLDGDRIVLAGIGQLDIVRPWSAAEDVAALARVCLALLEGSEVEAPTLVAGLQSAASGAGTSVAELRQVIGLSTESAPLGMIRNPYKGLAPFDVTDADDFFGRKDVVADLVERAATDRLVALVGPSGSGKSSVVRAGLLPMLADRAELGGFDWYGVTMVPGSDPFEAVESGLLRLAVNPPATLREQLLADERGLVRAARRCLPDDRSELLLVIDQFEELYALTSPALRDRFIGALVTAIEDPESRVRVILTIRADLFDRPLADPAFGELLAKAAVSLPGLGPVQLEEAIVGPARRVGLVIEPSVVAELVRAGVAAPASLPLVQFTLTTLADQATGDVVTADELARLGGVEGAIARRADEVFTSLPEGHQSAARTLFGRLVAVGSGTATRQRAVLADLGDDTRTVGEAFAQARLLTYDRDTETRVPTIEVAHESLLTAWPRLREWIADDLDELRTAHRVATATQAWHDSDQDRGELLRGAALAAATDLAAHHPERLTPSQHTFVAASEAARLADDHRRRRNLRNRLSGGWAEPHRRGMALARSS